MCAILLPMPAIPKGFESKSIAFGNEIYLDNKRSQYFLILISCLNRKQE